jgi:arylsulfatase A-like enzyme
MTNLPPLQGISLSPVLEGKTAPPRSLPLYWKTTTPIPQQALRMDHWKILKPGPDVPFSLYDLNTDPAEKHNLANKHPEIIKQAAAFLESGRSAE